MSEPSLKVVSSSQKAHISGPGIGDINDLDAQVACSAVIKAAGP
jgi:hypothetical protein